MEIIIASKNPGKIREIVRVLDVRGLDLKTFRDLPGFPEPVESGDTLEENAAIKAEAVRDLFDTAALADDSGLLVDRLGGRPGVRSSRYAGPACDPERNMDLLLRELEGVPEAERTARFACVVALARPGEETLFAGGECGGRILAERRGGGGFGYDPVFLPDGFDRSMAELDIEEKNRISHRGKALRGMRSLLERLCGD